MFSKSADGERPNRWTVIAYAYGLVVAAVIGYFLLQIPIQLTDSYGNLVSVSQRGFWPLVYNQFYQSGYLRPLLWGNLSIVYTASAGHYFAWFRGWHVAQVVLLVVFFLRLVRPRTPAAAAAVPVGLAALVGVHTFAGTVVEAFPINTFMTVLLCCFAAADLALGPSRWWRDVAAALLFLFAAFTVESGLLVAVVFVAAYGAGARGVSRAGVAAIVLLMAGYLYLRFAVLHVGSPGLVERSSGYGFSKHDPDDLIARFGSNPLPFYAYNVLSSIASVLLSEPRSGIWQITYRILHDSWRVYDLVNVAASALGTTFIAAYAWVRRSAWLARDFNRSDRLVIIFAAVAVANAAISYAYTKDVIMSPAGIFLAAALTVSVQYTIEAAGRLNAGRQVVVGLLLLTLSSAWAFRAVGMHVSLRRSGATTRNEWAYADQWLAREHQTPQGNALALKRQLQDDATWRHPLPPPLVGDWLDWFEE